MTKKILSFICWIALWLPLFSLAVSYEFSNYPITDKDIKTYEKYQTPYLIYKWDTDFKSQTINFNDIDATIKDYGYFKFFRYSYYWKDTFSKLKDSELNFWYLDDTKLKYPVVSFYVKNRYIFLIHNELVSPSYKAIIWNKYESNSMLITKFRDWYKITIFIEKDYEFAYDYQKYLEPLRDLINAYPVVSYQVWQNPFDEYNIENFWNKFIQLELHSWWKLKWIILSLKKFLWASPTNSTTKYWDDYYYDEYIEDKLIDLYTTMKNYYNYMWALPSSLWDLSETFTDISALNKYDHKLKYETINTYCYNIGFKPKSPEFIKEFADSINSDWYWFVKVCIK